VFVSVHCCGKLCAIKSAVVSGFISFSPTRFGFYRSGSFAVIISFKAFAKYVLRVAQNHRFGVSWQNITSH